MYGAVKAHAEPDYDGVPAGGDPEEGSYVFPVTFAQRRLWFLDRLQPGNTFYLIAWSIRISGPLQVAALRQSLNEIIRRHEILRTTFGLQEGEPVQVVRPSLELKLPLVDLSGRGDREAEALRLAAAEAKQPLDLEKGPLVRGQLLCLGAEEHVLLLTMHHIIFDGGSRHVFVRELSESYEAFCQGREPSLPDLPLQYADFAVWQREHLEGKKLEEQCAYWKRQLEGAPATLALPTDRPRPAVQSYRGAVRSFAIPRAVTAELSERFQASGASLFMTLLAGFNALLARYSGQSEIVVGTPIAGRNRVEIEGLIGLFANTLALRTSLAGDPTFRELVGRVKETALGAYAHQDAPFERLVEELQPERSLSYNPIFQVMFSLQNAGRATFRLAGLELKPLGAPADTAKFDLSVFLAESPAGMQGHIEYNTDLFDGATIERLLGSYQTLLGAAAENPERRISELPLLTAAERKQILGAWNDTAMAYPRELCLHQWIEQQAARTPDQTAGIFGDERISYSELNRRANQLAHYLCRMGVQQETLVGVSLERSLEMLVAVLGVLKSGGAYVPLDPAYPKERLGHVLEDSRAPLVITQQRLAAGLPEFAGRTICIDAEWPQIAVEAADNPAGAADCERRAYVLYTSGSTGKPKGVEITHRNLVNFLASMQQEPGLRSSDVLLAVTTLSFDIAGLELYLPLVTGATVVVASRDDAADAGCLMALLEKWQPTVLQATPATWWMLIEGGWQGNAQLKALCGGEAMPAELANKLMSRCGELWNMYGPTETTIWSTVKRVGEPQTGTVSIGRPIGNTTVYVLDAAMEPVPVGVAGELYIGGDGVARGYFQRPELTAEKFLRDPFVEGARVYRTGDLARFLADGSLQFLGRQDHQVKIRGFRIELGDIEAVLGRHPSVKECAVSAREDTPGDKRLVGYVVADANRPAQPQELRAWIREHLPEYMVPSAMVLMERFPLTPNGKVDRKNLPAPDYALEARPARVAPRTPLEEKLAAVWSKVLKVPNIGVRDNFFDLGGHSLMAVQLFQQMQAATGKTLHLNVLFTAPTIEELARILELEQACETTATPQGSLRPVRPGNGKPPLYAAHGIGGTVLTFRELTLYLEADQPVYCLEAMDLNGNWSALEELAAHYVRDIRAFQPEGPYYLTGSSFGGMLVFEIAQQLCAQGQEVAFLGLLDTANLGQRNLRTRRQRLGTYMVFLQERGLVHLRRLFTRGITQWPRYVVGRILAVGRRLYGGLWRIFYKSYRATPVKGKVIPARLLNLKRAYHAAGTEYVPKVYPGCLTLFRAEEHGTSVLYDPERGWGGLALGGLEIIDVPGDHNTMLKNEANVRVLAREMTECIARGAARTAGKLTAKAR